MKKLAVLLTLLLSMNLFAQGFFGRKDYYELEIINPYTSLKPGDTGKIITKITMAEDWTAYYRNPGALGQAVSIKWQLPEGFTASALKWQTPKAKNTDFGKSFYYQGEAYFISDLASFANIKPGKYRLNQTSNITVCDIKGLCLQGSDKENSFEILIGDKTEVADEYKDLIAKAEKKLIAHPTEQLKTTAIADGYELTINLETELNLTDLEQLLFIPDNKRNSIAKDSEVKTTKTATGYQITLLLATDHQVKDSISGILLNPNKPLTAKLPAIHFQSQVKGKVLESKLTKLTWTSEEKAEHAKLYDENSLIHFGKEIATKEQNKSIGTVLLFAFVGGLILNLMPCVFPVLGLKVMGFVQLAGNDPKKIKLHGLAFTLGILVSMWILAGAILLIRESTPVSWGEQMGNPIFVSSIIIMLFLLGLNMYGVFEIGTSLTSAGGNLQNKKGYSGSLFSGVLTTLIATPCSGPFLGTTMSYTLEQPAFFALIIFSIFALGIAFPYLLLAFIPALINKLPKPGAWMEVFKKFMAFPLFATAVFFLKAFGGQTGNNGMFWLSMALVLFGMAAWAYGTWSNPYLKKQTRYLWGFGLPVVILVGAVWMTADAVKQKPAAHTPEGWQQWHPGLVEHHLSKKRIVWVDYTADW